MDTENKFAVVMFTADKTYSEIPVSWLTPNKKKCYWPKIKNVSICMAKNIVPDKTWDVYDITLEKLCPTLESARKRAEKSDYTTSEDEEDRGRGKRVRKSRKHTDSSSSDTTSVTSEVTPPPTPPPVQIIRTYNNNEINKAKQQKSTVFVDTDFIPPRTSSIDFVVDLNNQNQSEQSDISNAPVVMVKDNITILDVYMGIVELTNKCNTIEKYVKNIQKQMKTLSVQEGDATVTEYMYMIENEIPLKTIEAIKTFDSSLRGSDNVKNAFVTFIKSIGGREAKDNINRILKALFTNELGTHCSWKGLRNNNFKICDLYITRLISDIVMLEYKDAKQVLIESVASEWFRLANQRTLREGKKEKVQ